MPLGAEITFLAPYYLSATFELSVTLTSNWGGFIEIMTLATIQRHCKFTHTIYYIDLKFKFAYFNIIYYRLFVSACQLHYWSYWRDMISAKHREGRVMMTWTITISFYYQNNCRNKVFFWVNEAIYNKSYFFDIYDERDNTVVEFYDSFKKGNFFLLLFCV